MSELPPEDEIICKCHQVSEKTIRDQIAEKNITEVEQVTKACEAGGGCQSCHMLLELFIDQHQAKMKSSRSAVSSNGKPAEGKLGVLRKLFRRFGPSQSTG
jgi:NifU-like protein